MRKNISISGLVFFLFLCGYSGAETCLFAGSREIPERKRDFKINRNYEVGLFLTANGR